MLKTILFGLFICSAMIAAAQENFASDMFKTAGGDLKITFIGHGSLLFNFKNLAIYVDPYGVLADFGRLPKASLILVTHQHQDHFDAAAIEKLRQKNTRIFVSSLCQPLPESSRILKNSESVTIAGIGITAVPAYNILNKRDNGVPFHPRGEGNGYLLTFADWRVYVAGDTENIPEMNELKDIAIAFLPMNLPYTMSPEMVAAAAKMFKPRILYPYHFGSTDPQRLLPLLKDTPEVSLRIRKLN